MVAGEVPYRDFSVEYPPGALAAFLAPELTAAPGDFGAYGHAFEKWMAGCGVALILFVGIALRVLRASLLHSITALALLAFAPLLLGNVMLSRFDLFPAALVAAAVAALLAEWELAAAVALGFAISVKLYPVAIVPVCVIWLWRRQGRTRGLTWLAVTALTTALVFLPFVVVGPGGLGHALANELRRPPQIESLPAAVLLAAHHLAGLKLHPVTSYGSQNYVGTVANAAGTVSTIVGAALLVAVWIAFARGRMNRNRLTAAVAAAIATVVAFSHVFSPQYMIWLLPVVVLARSASAAAILAAALVLTQIWFPDRYWELVLQQRAFVSWLVLARDLLVVALAVVLAEPLLEHNGLGERRAGREALEPIGREVET